MTYHGGHHSGPLFFLPSLYAISKVRVKPASSSKTSFTAPRSPFSRQREGLSSHHPRRQQSCVLQYSLPAHGEGGARRATEEVHGLTRMPSLSTESVTSSYHILRTARTLTCRVPRHHMMVFSNDGWTAKTRNRFKIARLGSSPSLPCFWNTSPDSSNLKPQIKSLHEPDKSVELRCRL